MKGSWPVPWPAGSKQNTPRGTSDNALLGVSKNAQNSAPNTKNIPRRRDWRCFLLVTFIVMPPDSISRALPNKTGVALRHNWYRTVNKIYVLFFRQNLLPQLP